MTAFDEILTFSQDRISWQRDAMRRLVQKSSLSEDDVRELLCILRSGFGLSTDVPAPTPSPLERGHLPTRSADTPPTILTSLEDLAHVNRLASGQKLPFATNGLTIVYGDNGSGKSGYCRVLKKLCRVREGGEEPLKDDAFQVPTFQAAEATVRFTVGAAQPTSLRWKDGTPAPEALSRISVFDVVTAPLYADQRNKLEFLPYGLDILPRLGDVCRKLSEALEDELRLLDRQLQIPLPSVAATTFAGRIIGRLDKRTLAQDLPTAADLSAAGSWDDTNETELAAAIETLRIDPVAEAGRCRSLQRSITTLAQEITDAQSLLSDSATASVQSLLKTARVTREAADLAAQQAFFGDPLPGTGSEPWRLMFHYAQEFVQGPHPDSPPSPMPTERCPLCQQPLGDEAAARLHRFEEFIRGSAEAAAGAAKEALATARSNLSRLHVRAAADVASLLADAGVLVVSGGALAAGVAAYLSALQVRRKALIAETDGQSSALTPLPVSPVPRLTEASARLQDDADRHDEEAGSHTRVALETRRVELAARKALSETLASVLARREDLDCYHRLRACRESCDTTAISRKNSDLRDKHITAGFRERLRAEIEHFDLTHLPFRLDAKSESGASYVSVGLNAKMAVRNREVLSDGEMRALALACFMTEVGTIPDHSGIVVDDPVSSLDHQRVRQVALRLVEEAAGGRQVIVFTHDLVFYYELWSAAAERSVPVCRHWIRKTAEHGYGTVYQNEEPWQVKKVKQRLGDLETKLAGLRRMTDFDSPAYTDATTDFYTDLRETWERAIEEHLFNGTVNRFQLGVSTLSLAGASVEDEDYRRVFFGMKRASEHSGHDRARAASRAAPRPTDAAKDLEDLKSFSTELGQRRKVLEERRRDLVEPPSATTA